MSAMISGGKINTADRQLQKRVSFKMPAGFKTSDFPVMLSSDGFYNKALQENAEQIKNIIKDGIRKFSYSEPLENKKIKDCTILELLKAVRDKTE